MLKIKGYRLEDHAVAVGIHNTNDPHNPTTVEGHLRRDAELRPDLVLRRYAAVLEGRVVGVGGFSQLEWAFHPHRFVASANVHPGAQGRGAGAALKMRALEHTRTVGIAEVRTDNDSRNAPMLAVNAKLGFERDPAWIALRKTIQEV